MLRATEIHGQLLEADGHDRLGDVLGEADRDGLAELVALLGLEQFDHRACNKALATCTSAATGR